jgi:hypothetical protein
VIEAPQGAFNFDDAADTLNESWEIWSELYRKASSFAKHSPDGTAAPLAAQPHLRELIAEQQDFERMDALRNALSTVLKTWLGPELWASWSANRAEFPRNFALLRATIGAQQAGTDGGVDITAAESAAILAMEAPALNASVRTEAMERMKATVANWSRGVLLAGSVPAGERRASSTPRKHVRCCACC